MSGVGGNGVSNKGWSCIALCGGRPVSLQPAPKDEWVLPPQGRNTARLAPAACPDKHGPLGRCSLCMKAWTLVCGSWPLVEDLAVLLQEFQVHRVWVALKHTSAGQAGTQVAVLWMPIDYLGGWPGKQAGRSGEGAAEEEQLSA